MDRIEHFRSLVKRILTQYAQYQPSYGDLETMLIFDERRDHYQLMYEGWDRTA